MNSVDFTKDECFLVIMLRLAHCTVTERFLNINSPHIVECLDFDSSSESADTWGMLLMYRKFGCVVVVRKLADPGSSPDHESDKFVCVLFNNSLHKVFVKIEVKAANVWRTVWHTVFLRIVLLVKIGCLSSFRCRKLSVIIQF